MNESELQEGNIESVQVSQPFEGQKELSEGSQYYTRPELKSFGTVRELTLGGNPINNADLLNGS